MFLDTRRRRASEQCWKKWGRGERRRRRRRKKKGEKGRFAAKVNDIMGT